jgi:hypothetical protein
MAKLLQGERVQERQAVWGWEVWEHFLEKMTLTSHKRCLLMGEILSSLLFLLFLALFSSLSELTFF